MIKINLVQIKRRKTPRIPFGWIIVVGYALSACAVLYLISDREAGSITQLEQDLDGARAEVKKVKQFSDQKAARKKDYEKLAREKQQYEQMLNSSGGGWTQTLLLFEDILKASKTVWFRDLRIEGDGRVQITGFSKENDKHKKFPGITSMLDAFKTKETQFKTPRLKRISNEPFLDQVVSTFELVCVLTR